MPEISATNLRRLEELGVRLKKAHKEKKALAAERRELRSVATTHVRRVRLLQKRIEGVEAKLDAALEENAGLAAKLETSAADLEQLQSASLELRGELDASRTELEQAKKSAAVTEEELTSLRDERDRLAEQLSLASAQLEKKAIAPVLPPAEVSKLVDGFVSDLGARLSGMTVRDGELQLKVGFEKVGRKAGFVVPSSESPPEVRDSLHEISIRFGRTPEIEP